MKLDVQRDYEGGANPIYWGEAIPGTSPATARWRIKKLTYSGNTIPVESWANGSKKFDKQWDIRGSYTYITS